MNVTRTTTTLAAVTAIAGLAVAGVARADSPSMFITFGSAQRAEANFDSTSGCVDTHVRVNAVNPLDGNLITNDGVVHGSDPGAFVAVSKYDHCSDTQQLAAFSPCCGGPRPPGFSFTVARDLTSARLDETTPLVDSLSNTTLNVTLRLTWTAIPPLLRGVFEVNETTPGLPTVHTLDVGSGYVAQASGTVSDGSTNYTPNATTDASIRKDTGGFMHIGAF